MEDGGFLAVWDGAGPGGSTNQTWARRFAADSTARDDAFRVNTFDASNNQTNPAVASDPRGGFAIVWQSLVQDGDGFGIYARRGGFPDAGRSRSTSGPPVPGRPTPTECSRRKRPSRSIPPGTTELRGA